MGKSEPETFNRAILPGLSVVALRAMAVAIGLTEGDESLIRRGLRVSYRRHLAALSWLADEHTS